MRNKSVKKSLEKSKNVLEEKRKNSHAKQSCKKNSHAKNSHAKQSCKICIKKTNTFTLIATKFVREQLKRIG